jgi:hypothetical protein
MRAKEIIMGNTKKAIDKLPASFASEKEAGEFWDAHSLMDYAEHLEPAKANIRLEKRIFEIQVAEDVFNRLRSKAKTSKKSLPKVVDQILRKELTLT